MLPVAYRIIKGFATFFGIIGVLACIGGIIGGIIANDSLKKKDKIAAQANQVVVPGAVQGVAHQAHNL